MFDRDAGGEADPQVRVTHEWPSFGEGGGGRRDIAEGFEFTTQLLFRRRWEPSGGRCGFRALVGDAVEGGLATAATDSHVHVAVLRADDDIGHGERTTGRKDLLAGFPAAAFRRQVNRVERGESPIAGVERALVSGGEFSTRAHGRSGGGTGAHIDQRRLHVERRERVIAGAGAPTQLATGRAEVDARWAVPWSAHVPFHVGIVGEDIAVWRDGTIVGITEGRRHADPVLAVLVHAGNPAADGLDAGCVAVGVFELLQQVIFVVTLNGCAGLFIIGQLSMVTADHEDRAIAVEDQLVGAVFARALERPNQSLLSVSAVALDVAEAPDVTLTLFAGARVEGAVGEEQPVATDGLRINFGDGQFGGVLEGHVPKHAPLVPGDQIAGGRDRE